LRKRYGIARTYASWPALLADKEIDAVMIALPNALHAPACLDAIKAGKHVLVDKPFAMNSNEARRIVAAAKKKRVQLMVGMNQRYSIEAQTMHAIVERGEIGDIYHTKAAWCRRAGIPKFGTWFVVKEQSGGGCMLDIGVHVLDLGMYLAGAWDPVAVSGQVYSKFGARNLGEGDWGKSDRKKSNTFNVDDSAMALIKCASGATVELNVSWAQHQETANRHNVELYGTEGGASLLPMKLFRFGKNESEYEVVERRNARIPNRRVNRQADWLDGIAGKRQPICDLAQALTVQKVLDAVYQSSATGREVRIAK
jgi:predicted dehydrogenase